MSSLRLTPTQIVDIRNRLNECSNSLTRIAAEREHMREVFKDLKDVYGFTPKLSRRLAKAAFKRNKQEVVAEDMDFADTYDVVFEDKEE